MRNGPETGRRDPSRVTSTAAKFTALLLAAMASSGCGESTPTGFSTYKAAKNCLTDKVHFPDLSVACSDRAKLVGTVLSDCGLPPGDSTVKLGDSTVTVKSRAEEAINEVCK